MLLQQQSRYKKTKNFSYIKIHHHIAHRFQTRPSHFFCFRLTPLSSLHHLASHCKHTKSHRIINHISSLSPLHSSSSPIITTQSPRPVDCCINVTFNIPATTSLHRIAPHRTTSKHIHSTHHYYHHLAPHRITLHCTIAP